MQCDEAWVGLGGNLGDVRSALATAREGLAALSTRPPRVSPVYGSEPWGKADQPVFLNQIIGFVPRLSPAETLAALQALEARAGRARDVRWGPRTLDLDLLCWPGLAIHSPDLMLPHPRLAERRFVLAPWADVAPDLIVPGLERTVAELLAACPDAGRVWRESP